MGIFDKKKRKGDDFDSPVEEIDLSTGAPSEAMAATTAPSASAAVQTGAEEAPAPAAPKPRRKPTSDYGIDEAIALMRTLPQENVELVVRVVKHTLESTNIEIPAIITDATAKQERIEKRISVLKEEISDLEKEIQTRRAEIGTLEADHKETTMVKERLELAEKLGKKSETPAATSASASAAPVATGSSTGSSPLGKPSRELGSRTRSPSTSPPPRTTPTSTHSIVTKK